MIDTPTVQLQPKLAIRQICYSPETMAQVPDGFLALDYLDNSRPDWREYWPIRQFLLNNVLDDHTLYGFFSPKFAYKTQLDFEHIQHFAQSNFQSQDLMFFSPFWDLSSFFVNIFEQGDFFHPGLREASQLFADSVGLDASLNIKVTHSENNVFCNYVLGSKSFWMRWLELGERLVFAAEHPHADSHLKFLLNQDTSYGEDRLPRKIFLMERLTSLLLMNDTSISTCAYDSFKLQPSITPLNRFFNEAVQCNALKLAYARSGSPFNLHAFMALRQKVFQNLH